MIPTSTRACGQCGHPIRGRIDKKFCNDQCRNAFNNERNSAHYATVRRVNAVLLRNRRILEKLLAGNESTKVREEELLIRGFQFRFGTHEYENARGGVYHFCYEFGWLAMRDGRCLVVRRDGTRQTEG